MHNKNPVYFPVLRPKQGERNALISIATPVADKIAPRFVLPPPKERDTETGRVLSQDEFIYCSGRRIGHFWPLRVCYIEPRYLFKEYGDDKSEEWLPRLFQIARDSRGLPVPLASLDDATSARSLAFRRSIPADLDIKLGLRICFADLEDDLKPRINAAMETLGVASRQCVVFIDFADADLSDPVVVSEFLGTAFQTLQEIGVWAQIVFQGTNYPEKNPATPGTIHEVIRTEWQAWGHLIAQDQDAFERLAFGDYGADSAKFMFAGGGGIPIRHLRYCGNDRWLVARGHADIPQGEAMVAVAKMILKSSAYTGREFSRADDRVYKIANELEGGGNASIWREINTAHHITKVVSDLGKLYGFNIDQNEVEKEAVQEELFPAE